MYWSYRSYNDLYCRPKISFSQTSIATVRARVVIKSDKHPCGPNGLGLMLTANLIDYSGEIRLVAFGPSVHYLFDSIEVMEFYQSAFLTGCSCSIRLQVDQIFDFTNFVVKRCDPKQGVGQVNRVELICSGESRVQRVADVSKIPNLKFNFQPLETVDKMRKNEMVDVIAICESYGGVEDTPLKSNIMGQKRELNLVDQSKTVCSDRCVVFDTKKGHSIRDDFFR